MELTDIEAGGLLAGAKAKFESAYSRARAHPASPYRTFDFKRDEFLRRCYGQVATEQLKILTEAEQYFRGMVDDPNSFPLTRTAEQQMHDTAAAAAAGAQLAAMGLTFNPSAFIRSLRGRGVTMAVGADGRIVVAPASALNETDRSQLRNHKPEIVAVLGDSEEF
jgi:hypothetical protein